MDEGSPLVEGLKSGAVAVCGCRLSYDHYVLITGLTETDALIFDPYYDEFPPARYELPATGVKWVDDQPLTHNRVVARSTLNDPNATVYSLYATSGRDAVLVWRTDDSEVSWYG